MAKEAEGEFARMCAHYNWWAHKWADVRYCPNCHAPIFITRRTDGNDKQEVKESIVDYQCFAGSIPFWVEVKGKPGQTRLAFDEIMPHQRKFLASWEKRGVDTFLFFTLGDGRVPTGRWAWMIPWYMYLSSEAIFAEKRKSISDEMAFANFKVYQLEWGKYNAKTSGWLIPDSHYLHSYDIPYRDLPPLYEETNV